MAAGVRREVSRGSRGHRLQVGPQGRADVPVDISIGNACLLHPGPVAVPHAVRRKPGQHLAASSPRHCVRPGLRRGDGRCGDEMTGACESHSSNGRARRHNRHLTLRRKGSEERAEDFVMSDDAVLRLAGLYRA
jgi:hypothetical protein